MITAMVSGGFDPLHVGHLDLIIGAHGRGSVMAVVMSDDWLIRKKGRFVMPLEARMRLVGALRLVGGAYTYPDEDGTVCVALACLRPDYFVNSGDRIEADPREDAICRELGIEQVFLGQPKVESSSRLMEAYDDHHPHTLPG